MTRNLELILIKDYGGSPSNYGMSFNHSASQTIDSANPMFSGDSLTVVSEGNTYNFRLDERTKKSWWSYIFGNIIEDKYKYNFALEVDDIINLQLILMDKEVKNSENKNFIEYLKELSTQEDRIFVVFDEEDITLKINIDQVVMNMPEQKFYSKVDVRINDKIDSEDIINMLEDISYL